MKISSCLLATRSSDGGRRYGRFILAGRAAAIENSNWRPPSQRDDCRLYTTNRVEDAADGKVRERERRRDEEEEEIFFTFFFFSSGNQQSVPIAYVLYIVSPYIHTAKEKKNESLCCAVDHIHRRLYTFVNSSIYKGKSLSLSMLGRFFLLGKKEEDRR